MFERCFLIDDPSSAWMQVRAFVNLNGEFDKGFTVCGIDALLPTSVVLTSSEEVAARCKSRNHYSVVVVPDGDVEKFLLAYHGCGYANRRFSNGVPLPEELVKAMKIVENFRRRQKPHLN